MTKIIDRTGEVSYNNFGSKIIIKEYRGSHDIDVYFPEYDYIKKHTTYRCFIEGYIKSPYEPRVFRKGYLGEGEYNTVINGKLTKSYHLWFEMLKRAYSSKYIQRYPTYRGCTVHDSWLNFQVFAEWVDKNYYKIEGEQICLDKDILYKGNKIYSSETCVFVPQSINKLFTKSDKCRGDLPIGVSYYKSNKKYVTHCNMDGKKKHLGYYDSPEQAFEVYKQYKEKEIKKVAEEYKDKIPTKLYKAMINYKIEIDD